MNRENKKIRYEKGYYKTHTCTDSFTCRNCGWLVVSDGAGSAHPVSYTHLTLPTKA